MLKQNIETYLTTLRVADMSPLTLKSYRYELETFAAFVGPEVDVRDISVPVVRAHLHRLAFKGLCAKSRNHALAVLKAFGKFLVNEDLVGDDVFEVIPRAKMPQRLPDPPTVEVMNRLLDGEMPTRWPARDRALIELLYGTGARVSEAANIHLADIRGNLILIHGKGDKERLVPIGGALRRALEVYLPERKRRLRTIGQESDALFFSLSNQNKLQSPAPLDVRSVWRILHDACVAKEIKPLHPHALRHACATHMLDNGASLIVIQKLLGHAKLSTTSLYAFVSTASMQRAYSLAHPSCRNVPVRTGAASPAA